MAKMQKMDYVPVPLSERKRPMAEVRQLSVYERRAWVELIRIKYPNWSEIRAAIQDCHEMQPIAAAPPCLLILGESGVGKTTLAQSYADRYPPTETDTEVIRPVVMVRIPAASTRKQLAHVILEALGDPRAAIGTEGNMTLRIARFFKDCRVQVLILDELQHMFDENDKVLGNTSNWLKNLVQSSKVACILIGTTSLAELVIDLNPQLARHFSERMTLAPFEWVEGEDKESLKTIKLFKSVLASIEQQMPLQGNSNLTAHLTAHRCWLASRGMVGYLVPLIRRACRYALQEGKEQLDYSLLARAFDVTVAVLVPDLENPFISTDKLPAEGRYTVKTVVRDPGATNKRGRPRGPRRTTISQVFAKR